MSRHRFVKDLARKVNLDQDDEVLSDGGEDDMTPEQHLQLATAVTKVREVLGPESESGITDTEISDIVWNYYFDVETSIDMLLKEQARKAAAVAKKAQQQRDKSAGSGASGTATPKGPKKKAGPASGAATPKSSVATPRLGSSATQQSLDISGMRLDDADVETYTDKDVPKASLARAQLLEEVKTAFDSETGTKALSIVVVGHVDAGKSTLMGRLLYETGKMDERKRIANERGSAKEGKASFSWAWEMDGTEEERQKGVTKDIAQRTMITQSRHITILDAPGHKDFIPNMISGAAQADAALLVVDSSVGSFESGFDRGGQTQEHMQLVRSLGVTQIVVAVNKLDMVEWSQQRYDEICTKLSQFLQQTGFQASRTKFVPVCAMGGINLVNGSGDDVKALTQWYSGLSLIDCLNELEPPQRQIDAPLRIPLVNVFRGQTSLSHGVGVSGRICSGVVQVGDRLRVVPGDEVAAVRLIDYEDESVPWAAAGSNATFYLAGIDPIHLSVGSVLCSLNEPVRMSSSFEAKIMLFDLQKPVLGGTSVELFCHAREAPATITKLVATLDRSTGAVTRNNPRVLQRNSVAIVQISLRTASLSGSVSSSASLPLEISDANKDMSRILLRSEGETIGAGMITAILL